MRMTRVFSFFHGVEFTYQREKRYCSAFLEASLYLRWSCVGFLIQFCRNVTLPAKKLLFSASNGDQRRLHKIRPVLGVGVGGGSINL